MNLKQTPFHDIHVKLGAKMHEFAGYDMPIQYEGINAEHMAVLESVGVFDVSHMGAVYVSGPKALEFLQNVCSNDISKLKDGKAQYNYMPNDKGGIVDDFIIYCFGDYYMLAVNAANIEKDFKWLQDHAYEGVVLDNKSPRMSILAIQGPNAKATIQKKVDINLDEIPYYNFKQGKFAGIDTIISNTGYTGAGGFELYFLDIADAQKVWDELFEAGAEFDIKPVGLGARDTLRLEKAFCLYGNDIDETTNPLEAGLGWVTKLIEGKENLPSRKILEETKTNGVQQKLVGIEIIGRGIPRHGYDLEDTAGNKIGHLTSGTMAPALKKGIALGYVKKDFTALGTRVFVNIRDKQVEAEVVKTPFRD